MTLQNRAENKPIINKAIKTLLAFVFIFNVSAGLYMPIIAIFITQNIIGATLATVGVSIAIYSIVKAIFQIPIARRLDIAKGERDDFYVLLLGIILAIFYSLAYLFIKNINDLYFLQILTGIADACIFAAYYAIFSHHIDRESQGFEWSLFSVGGLTVSTSIGGLTGGYIATVFGFEAVFILASSLNIVAALVLLILFPYVKNFRFAGHYKNLKIGKR
ncbi:MAG: MFS transporter [bacterium]